VDANDLSIFIFAWHCNAGTLGEFSWEEFRRGAEELRIDSIAAFKGTDLFVCLCLFFFSFFSPERVGSMKAELIDPVSFKRFYGFVFNYGKEGTQKALDLASAVELWYVQNMFAIANVS
jgi:hypothetical protein